MVGGQRFETQLANAINGDGVILVFRFSGRKPMLGYRSKDGVFNILWLDRAFKLYDHG